jgi:hypothetical protein
MTHNRHETGEISGECPYIQRAQSSEVPMVNEQVK